MKTGGPVYDNEEDDVLRGACINIIAELVATMNPSAIANYCSILVNLGVNVLQLEQSRVVRRPAALLCRELYACSLREGGQYSVNMKAGDAEFTIVLVKEDEILQATLWRCTAGDDVDVMYGDKVIHSVKDQRRLYDPATVARCREALEVRQEIIECGFLDLVQLYVKSTKGADTQLDRFIEKELQTKSPKLILDYSLK